VDGEMLPTDPWPRLDRFREHIIELPLAEIKASADKEAALRAALGRALDFGKGAVHVLAANGRNSSGAPVVFSTRRACPSCGTSYPDLDPRLFSFNSKHGWCETCFRTGMKLAGFDEEQTGEEVGWNEWYEGDAQSCPDCAGARLNPVALGVRFRERSIAELTALSVDEAAKLLGALELSGREAEIARDLAAELRSRLSFLQEVGLG